jgi:hypothetical protein
LILSVPSIATGVGVSLGGRGVKVNEGVSVAVVVSEVVMTGVTTGAGPVQAVAIPARSINKSTRFFIGLNSSTKKIGFWVSLAF